jgi:cysteine desulfuration protein SufE
MSARSMRCTKIERTGSERKCHGRHGSGFIAACCYLPGMRSLSDISEEYEFLDGDERYRLLIELGRELDPMPAALKTDATLVRGCSASVWVYPTRTDDGRLHFLADSNAAITKGIVALVIAAVQDRAPAEVAATDVAVLLEPFDLKNQLSSNRTQGVPNMIALIRETAARYAET